jgi:hypothetical protein
MAARQDHQPGRDHPERRLMTSCQGAGGTGTLYTYAQLEGLWISAGGPRAVAPIAAAIAEAESGGCSTALNLTDNNGTQTSWGLWQVSNGTHSQPAAGILDAAVNAEQAVAKYKSAGNSFSPWGTYQSGAYTAYLSGSTTADTSGVPAAGSGQAPAAGTSACLVKFGGVAGVGSVCFLSKSQARALIGGSLIALSAVVGLVGAVVLAAAAFRATGAARAVGRAAEAASVIPGAGLVASAVRGSESKSAAPKAKPSRSRGSESKSAAPAPKPSRSPSRASGSQRAASTPAAAPPSAPTASAARPRTLTAAERAELRARADKVSTRVEPARA